MLLGEAEQKVVDTTTRFVLTRRHCMSRPRPKNNADRKWQAQKPMRDDLSNATDEDGEAEDGHTGLFHDVHGVHHC